MGTEFSTRLMALRKNAGLNQRELAERIDLSTSSISYYEIGKRSPDINGLRRLSIFFNVSADYLLGLSNAKTNDKDLQAICDYTGLSQIAVATLHASSNVKFNQFINDFILFVAQQ